jgi:exonuclease VII small subunit
MDNPLPNKIPNIDPAQSVEPTGQGPQQEPKTSFGDYMKQTPAATEAAPSQATSPLDLSKGQVGQAMQPTMGSIQSQFNTTSNTLNTVESQLNTKNLKLKQSQNYLLRNKLSEADTHIRTAASKVGVDVGQPPSLLNKQNPINRYLGLIASSQTQLAQAETKIKQISANGQTLAPGELLLVQIKLNKAQQALDYSSVLLGKAVDDIKMLFNVQI